jgi:hypothetical protein
MYALTQKPRQYAIFDLDTLINGAITCLSARLDLKHFEGSRLHKQIEKPLNLLAFIFELRMRHEAAKE